MNIKTILTPLIAIVFLNSCVKPVAPQKTTSSLPNDPDDAAVWINPADSNDAIIFINDKHKNGGIYAFDKLGNPLPKYTINNLRRPNNVDIIQNVKWKGKTCDLLIFTERNTMSIGIYSLPDMEPLGSNGKFNVFNECTEKNIDFHSPMGLSATVNKIRDSVFIYVSRKNGPKSGYLGVYLLTENEHLKLLKFIGDFSGKKEIEAVAIDSRFNRLYYSDETFGIHVLDLNSETSISKVFGKEHFKADMEGIAIIDSIKKYPQGLIAISDQQASRIIFFDRTNQSYIGYSQISAIETDGIEFSKLPIVENSEGTLFVMNDKDHNFHYYTIESLIENLKN
jgi:3-phytase